MHKYNAFLGLIPPLNRRDFYIRAKLVGNVGRFAPDEDSRRLQRSGSHQVGKLS
jgi:hypothetical protein